MKKEVHQKIGQYDKRHAFSRKDVAEFRTGKKEFVQCPECKNVYYKKSWHHNLNQKSKVKDQKSIRFEVCPACKMAKDGRFEGQMVTENVPKDIHAEAVGLIKNLGDRATEVDPQDRITEIKDGENKIEVFTTENQLAKRIARRIKETYGKKVKQKITYSQEEDVVRVHLTFN